MSVVHSAGAGFTARAAGTTFGTDGHIERVSINVPGFAPTGVAVPGLGGAHLLGLGLVDGLRCGSCGV